MLNEVSNMQNTKNNESVKKICESLKTPSYVIFETLLQRNLEILKKLQEETGVKVTNIRYYKSQPWGMAQDILVGYFCDAADDGEIHMDKNELKYAEWVKREDIILQPNNLSLTNEMMSIFKDGAIRS